MEAKHPKHPTSPTPTSYIHDHITTYHQSPSSAGGKLLRYPRHFCVTVTRVVVCCRAQLRLLFISCHCQSEKTKKAR
jgi:hypothetical protein